MSKLKSAVLYEYLTKVRAIGIFYLIQYLIVALIFTIVAICTKGNETGSNTLEFSSVVFVSVIGVLGYKEDFKALLQNGYTRKYIFGATVCMFTLLAGTMALIDTIIGNSLHFFNSNYFTLYNNELFAVIAQIATFTWLGLACGIAYLFCENVEFDPVKQVVGYLISLTVGMLPLAWTGQWFEHVFIGIFSYVFIVAVISLFIFLIGLVKLKCDVNEIKQALGIGKED